MSYEQDGSFAQRRCCADHVCRDVVVYRNSCAGGGFDVRSLNLHDYAYPESHTAREAKEQYDASLLMYSHDSAGQVVEFYEEKDLKSDSVHPEEDRVVLEKMVAPHVPLKVVISSKATHNKLSDNVLYRNLEVAAGLGNHDKAELDQARRRFDGFVPHQRK